MTSACRCTGTVATKQPGQGQGQVILRWVDGADVEHRHQMENVDGDRFHENRPVRRFGRYDNMRHFPGLYWCATTARLLPFESWGERAWAMVMDFDPTVTGIAAQPFQFVGCDAAGLWHHVPDYWASRADLPPLVLDVRPELRCHDESFARLVGHSRELCARQGWEYRLVHDVEPLMRTNIEFLSAYRRGFPDPLGLRPQILDFLAEGPATIGQVCDRIGDAVVVLPQLFWLCWQHRLRFDLGAHVRYYSTQVSVQPPRPSLSRVR